MSRSRSLHCHSDTGPFGHRFFRVDESFRANTRAGLTRARSLREKMATPWLTDA
jgi:hypothetical protein